MGHDQIGADAQNCLGVQRAVLEQDHRWLEIVVEGTHAPTKVAESCRRGDAFEVDEDAANGVTTRDPSGDADDLRDVFRVDMRRLGHLHQELLTHAPCGDIRVERIDERITLGVIAEEDLVGLWRDVGARPE
jgi:hypothetical protein